jgi:hypothetical protein
MNRFSTQRHEEHNEHKEKYFAMLCITLMCVFMVLIFSFVRVAHAQEPLSLAAYRQVIEQVAALVDQAITQSDSAKRHTLAQQAADTLATAREVRLASGQVVPIHNESVLKSLREPSPSAQQLRDVRARLQALRAALGDPAVKELNAEELHQLREIFDKPPFKQERNWLAEWLEELLSRLFGNVALGIYDMRGLIMVLGGMMVALIIIFFLRQLRLNAAAESALPLITSDDEANLTSAQALSNAQRLASAGDYRSAVRQLYLSTLLLLDERGRLRYDRALTNREYLRAVAHIPDIANALRPIVETFDRVWYGFSSISQREFEAYRERVEMIRGM